jgi:tetratricopeptide (TPR) repeat protein
MLRRWPPQAVLLVTFACFYFAIGPGNYFDIDEAMEEETAQALILRRTLDIPAMPDARFGREGSLYAVKSAGLPFAALLFIYAGLKLDDAFGSMSGGELAGPPVGVEEHPLRWGGRLTISASLIGNALAGGAIVAVLFLVGMQLSPNSRAALLMAIAAGLATLVMSEATHFYQHALDALMVILAFWFFCGQKTAELESRALFGGLSLGVAVLARPDAAPAAVVLWLYGASVAWKLVRDLPDRWPRMIRQTALATAGPVGAVAGSMYFNYLRFGSFLRSGYTLDRERFVLDAAQIAKAIAGYLLSPALSIFVFAPPLILALALARRAYRRWPLETVALISAATAHLLLISSWKSWSGDLSYGPRYMLEAIVLLMPLTLPAFEMAADLASRRAVIAVAAVVSLGFVVQLIGVAVYVTVNEWYRTAAGIVDRGEWVFVPSASPIVYGLEEIVAGRNLAPWAIRASALPDAALLLLIVLVVIVWLGGRRILQYLRAPDAELANRSSRAFPIAIVSAALVPILLGFAIARPVIEAPGIHAYQLLNAGLAEQREGHAVAAEEDYAVVLSLDPSNEFARYDLGVLAQEAGRTNEAISLYQEVLREDPNFAPAKQNLNYILRTRLGFPSLH